MKTQEEIEKLNELSKEINNNEDYRKVFSVGYIKALQDNVDKKYTEEDMLNFANQYSSINILHLREHLKEFTLNKKD